jgi:hypothetical protein
MELHNVRDIEGSFFVTKNATSQERHLCEETLVTRTLQKKKYMVLIRENSNELSSVRKLY